MAVLLRPSTDPRKSAVPRSHPAKQSGQYVDCESSKTFHGTQNEDPRSNLAELTRLEQFPPLIEKLSAKTAIDRAHLMAKALWETRIPESVSFILKGH